MVFKQPLNVLMPPPEAIYHDKLLDLKREGVKTVMLFKLVPTGDVEKDVKTFIDVVERYNLTKDDTLLLFTEESLRDKLIETKVLTRNGKLLIHLTATGTNIIPMLTKFSDREQLAKDEQWVRDTLHGFGESSAYNYIEIHDGKEIRKGSV